VALGQLLHASKGLPGFTFDCCPHRLVSQQTLAAYEGSEGFQRWSPASNRRREETESTSTVPRILRHSDDTRSLPDWRGPSRRTSRVPLARPRASRAALVWFDIIEVEFWKTLRRGGTGNRSRSGRWPSRRQQRTKRPGLRCRSMAERRRCAIDYLSRGWRRTWALQTKFMVQKSSSSALGCNAQQTTCEPERWQSS
jgi:hypothetical protein